MYYNDHNPLDPIAPLESLVGRTLMRRIRHVEPLSGFMVRLELTDGSERLVDLGPYLRGPVFEPIRQDAQLFRSLAVDVGLGTIVWPNGADIDPDVLVGGHSTAWQEATGEVPGPTRVSPQQ